MWLSFYKKSFIFVITIYNTKIYRYVKTIRISCC